MLTMGQSKPWQDALFEITGKKEMDATAIRDYFAPLQAWLDEQVPPCGSCQPGQMLTAKVLLDKNPNPTDAQIRQGMATTLCRCMTYYRIQSAIKRAASALRAEAAPSQDKVNA